MYPNQGPPFGGGYNPYPGNGAPNQQPFGSGMPQPFGGGYPPMSQPGMAQPFGAGFPQMPQPGMPQPGMPQHGMPQHGMPQPGMPQPGMPQQPFNYQSPPMNQGFSQPPMGQPSSYPGQQSMPPQQQSFQGFPGAQPNYPQLPQGGFGMGAQPPTPQYQSPPYGAPAAQHQSYGQMQQTPSQPKGRPTVVPAANFNASNDAAALRKAMKGFGTDENAIIEVLCRRSNGQRIEICRTFKTAYGKDLIDDIKSESSGNFQRVLVSLLTPTTELYARELYESMYGGGTDEDVLIEVMCTMSNREIREIGATYYRMYGKSLEEELRGDTSGSFKRLMTSLSVGSRDESMRTDISAAQADAQELKRAGVDKFGTDESAFNRVLCLRNYDQLKLVAQEYEKLTSHTLEKDIKREFSGDIEDGLLAILRVAENRAEFFARRLNKSMAGIGTNDNSLIRLVVTRSEIDMVDIKEQFQRYYGKSLKSFIKGDTSGHYKHALYALIGENRS